ncbi:MAG: FecR domain-containing protein [Candidatus Pseudobacter hemicellulosilyticus]|uniref:FecR domain-containing protein n=1 Tax=Candidatus Pseudobacter hemicellulosilyticus TaxID=3121375 RepID=A0AAJ5WSB7_9BACT|nr:MAG: FecR domain-containing protein [Pseudobacter sp.]
MDQQQLQYVYDRIMRGDATEAERAQFHGFLSDSSLELPAREWLQRLIEEAASDESVPLLGDQQLKMLADSYRQLETAAPVRRLSSRRYWWRNAAAAVLLLTVLAAGWLLLGRQETGKATGGSEQGIVASDIQPGSEKAVLVLADGRRILLDSLVGNVLQEQGMLVTNNSGMLRYAGAPGKMAYHTLQTPRGGQYALTLPDGTRVWLNAASGIRYPVRFDSSVRQVSITGEAYFEVAANKEKPFLVIVNGLKVEVLGTRFNINSYSNEASISTTLLDGLVKLSDPAAAGRSVLLRPGQQAQAGKQLLVTNDPDIDQVMAWKNGKFIFGEGTGLAPIMRQIERWYDVDVIYEDGIPAISFAGEIQRDLNLSELLRILGRLDIQFRIEGKKLIVTAP